MVFPLSCLFVRFIAVVCSFSLLCNIPLHDLATMFVSILLLVNIWVGFPFLATMNNTVRTFLYVLSSALVYTYILLRVKFLEHISTLVNIMVSDYTQHLSSCCSVSLLTLGIGRLFNLSLAESV